MAQLSKRFSEPQPVSPKSAPARRAQSFGGTYINIVVAVIFFGLLAVAAWWVIKSLGRAGEQYTGVMIETKYQAEAVKCQMNLRAIFQNLQMYAVTNGRFPPSSKALAEWQGNSQLLRCPAPDGQQYAYVPGQSPDMHGSNVLLYEAQPAHDGRCNVLRLNGRIELLTPEELQRALAETRNRLISAVR